MYDAMTEYELFRGERRVLAERLNRGHRLDPASRTRRRRRKR